MKQEHLLRIGQQPPGRFPRLGLLCPDCAKRAEAVDDTGLLLCLACSGPDVPGWRRPYGADAKPRRVKPRADCPRCTRHERDDGTEYVIRCTPCSNKRKGWA